MNFGNKTASAEQKRPDASGVQQDDGVQEERDVLDFSALWLNDGHLQRGVHLHT